LYQQAIREEDCVADAYCNLGILQSKQGKTAQAFDSFTRSLQSNPRHLEGHYNLGNMYFDVTDYRLAQVHYQIAAEIDPSFANVYFNLALTQAINRDLGAAVAALTTYQGLVSEEEGRNAEELLENLKKSLATAQKPQSGRLV
jgi:tetratricopeptide (TPR) repeat protein